MSVHCGMMDKQISIAICNDTHIDRYRQGVTGSGQDTDRTHITTVRELLWVAIVLSGDWRSNNLKTYTDQFDVQVRNVGHISGRQINGQLILIKSVQLIIARTCQIQIVKINWLVCGRHIII